tara:strand:+ start:62 stop:673 length:612 start_codon:yes stop_codon:yes gene_type:complete
MPRRCPPGVLCIENITMLYIAITIGLVGFYFYYNKGYRPSNFIFKRDFIQSNNNPPPVYSSTDFHSTNRTGDILLNPYEPPLKTAPGFMTTADPRGVPINIKTQGFNSNYSQIGILTRNDDSETILPLMGRPLHSSRNKWQYYTMSDKNNSVKLPVSKNGRSATQEYGVDELFNSDSIYVEGYNDAFKVTIYDNNQPEYIPYV